jgi:hypothetical protein
MKYAPIQLRSTQPSRLALSIYSLALLGAVSAFAFANSAAPAAAASAAADQYVESVPNGSGHDANTNRAGQPPLTANRVADQARQAQPQKQAGAPYAPAVESPSVWRESFSSATDKGVLAVLLFAFAGTAMSISKRQRIHRAQEPDTSL